MARKIRIGGVNLVIEIGEAKKAKALTNSINKKPPKGAEGACYLESSKDVVVFCKINADIGELLRSLELSE